MHWLAENVMMTTTHNRPETEIENYFVQRVEQDLHGVALKLEVKGRRGWPDRIALLPVGVTFYVELKAPGGVLSRLQKQRRVELEALNQPYIVLWSKLKIDMWVARVLASATAAGFELAKGKTIQ